MKRLILAMQYPTALRYQYWWWQKLPQELDKFFSEVIVLGKDYIALETSKKADKGIFVPMQAAVDFEIAQIKEYMSLRLREDDVLLLTDISYPGLFANVLFHKRPDKAYAICHATSKNRYDVFMWQRKAKFGVEKSVAKLFDKIIVASEYHKKKLGWDNVKVMPFPYPPYFGEKSLKLFDVISVARPGLQKVTKKFEKQLEKDLGVKINKVPENLYSYNAYYQILSQAKVMLITSKEETFGYQIMDAIKNEVIPVAPNCCSYPELLPQRYLYSNQAELESIVKKAIQGELYVPELLCAKKSIQFYSNLIRLLCQ